MFTRILISTSYLHLLLPNCLFPSGLPSKSSYSRVLVLLLATYPFHLIPFDLFISICLVWNMNYEVPNYVIFFSLFFLHPSQIHHVFKHPRLRSVKVKDQVSHPYRTVGNVIVPLILIFVQISGEKTRDSETNEQAFSEFNVILISSCMQFPFVRHFRIFISTWQIKIQNQIETTHEFERININFMKLNTEVPYSASTFSIKK